MSTTFAAALMFPAAFSLILIGIPVAFSLLVVAVFFGSLVFGDAIGIQAQSRLLDVAGNYILAAIPLFIFMGAVLERSGVAERVFGALRMFLGRLPGGLALTTLAMCAIFAAAAGVVGAVEILVGMMAIPAMMKAGYRNDLIAGTVCAGGSLGTIIPPSVLVVVYASVTDLSVGDLLAGVILPGFLMLLFFAFYVFMRALVRPGDAPPPTAEDVDVPFAEKLKTLAFALAPCVFLITSVLGSIFAGFASPTEAGALGAIGAILLSLIYRTFSLDLLVSVLTTTITISGMIMFIIFGGVAFTSIFIVSGGGDLVRDFVAATELDPARLVLLFLGIVFLLGFLMDWVSVILIAIPILSPIIREAGIDPIWFGVLVCVALQTSYLTPPMAPSIFYLRSIAPPEMTYLQMYSGVMPFVAIQLLVLTSVFMFPALATYLPTILFRL